MKLLLPTVAGCASVALVGTLAVTAPTAFAASTEPEVTQEALSVSEDGLNVPGARASSDSSANVANQSATSNLPNIFKSQTAVASTHVPAIVNVSSGASAALPPVRSIRSPRDCRHPEGGTKPVPRRLRLEGRSVCSCREAGRSRTAASKDEKSKGAESSDKSKRQRRHLGLGSSEDRGRREYRADLRRARRSDQQPEPRRLHLLASRSPTSGSRSGSRAVLNGATGILSMRTGRTSRRTGVPSRLRSTMLRVCRCAFWATRLPATPNSSSSTRTRPNDAAAVAENDPVRSSHRAPTSSEVRRRP